MLRFQIDMRAATGTSVCLRQWSWLFLLPLYFMWLGQSANINLPWSTGFVYWPALLGVGLSSIFFAPLGTAIAYRLPIPVLKAYTSCFSHAGCYRYDSASFVRRLL